MRDSSPTTVTPEAVQLQVDVAGIGSRSIALLVDLLIQGLVLLVALIVPLADGVGGIAEAVVVSVVVFIVLWVYFPAFELLRRGQTPGKRFQGIRVVRTDGQPAGLAPILVRNLVRIVDVTLLPFLALISMVVTSRSQRLGDLAAGTMVILDRALPAPSALPLLGMGDGLPALDTSGMTERDYTVLRTFLTRRYDLEGTARQQLAHKLAARVREQIREVPGEAAFSDERLIEAATQSYRARYAERP